MKYTLSDICEYAKGKIDVATLNENTYISTENMMSNKAGITSTSSLPTVTQTQSFIAGDVLVSNIRPYFKKIWFAEFYGGCSNDVLVFRTKDGVNKRFLYYVLAEDKFFDYVMATSKGTKMPRGDKTAIMKYEVPDFTHEEQEKIAGILGAIDDKIALNAKINENLFHQVTAYFHHCFDAYEEVGESIVLLGDVAQFKYGVTPKKDRLGNGKYLAFSGYQVVGAYPEKMYSIPQLIIVARGVGGCGDIKYTPSNCYLTNLSIAILTENTAMEDYLFHYLRLHDTKVMNTGSAQPQITVSTLEKYRLPLPPQKLLEAFSVFIQPFKSLYRKNMKELKQLELLRDTLLPQLMSGELDVSDLDL